MIDLNKFESYDLENADGEFIDEKIIKIKFKFLKSFDQKYNIIIYIRELNARTDQIKKLTEKIISIDNRTR
jgi:hypothetical protein